MPWWQVNILVFFFVFFCFFFCPEENEEMLTNEKQTKTRFLLLFLLLLEAVACVEMEEEARKRLHQNQPNVSAHLNLVNILSFFFFKLECSRVLRCTAFISFPRRVLLHFFNRNYFFRILFLIFLRCVCWKKWKLHQIVLGMMAFHFVRCWIGRQCWPIFQRLQLKFF